MTPYWLLNNYLVYHNFVAAHVFSIVWSSLELLLSFFKGFAGAVFIKKFLREKPGKRGGKAAFYISSLLVSAIFFAAFFFFAWNENRVLIPLSLPVFLIYLAYSAIWFDGRIWEKLAASFFPTFVTVGISSLINMMLGEIFGSSGVFRMLFPDEKAMAWEAVFTAPVMIWFAFFVLLRLFGRADISGKKSVIQWACVSATVMISVFATMSIFSKYAYDLRNRLRLQICSWTVAVCFILSDIFVFMLINDIIKKNKAVNELNLLKRTEEYNRRYISHLQSEYETVRKLRHDQKNSFLVIFELLGRGEVDKAKEQIGEYLGEISGSEVFIDTENPAVNAVANSKLTVAKSAGIECECFVVRDISGISDADLSRLLSNMLDNAIEACERDKITRNKRIELTVMKEGEGYLISVRNTVPSPVLRDNPGLRTSKENGEEHGFGVNIIKEIAEKNAGRCDFYDEDGMFCCAVRVGRGR